ncbi:TolC family protein [Parabacteroides sp. 52]|uniref:TolC family protein n=1 Tax=Parabacteroides sp. 52 TaxID=2302940 RepID=UPI0013D45703|nr:TolC family protein [Parabacteroides sp. 52]NDV55123.1 TolC family protein [Parabacteroides sp. 52]
MKKIVFTIIFVWMMTAWVEAQEKYWTMEDCMRYAITYSPKVKKQVYMHHTYKAEYAQSLASFLPSISTNVSASYAFGRNVDDDNQYTNTTVFQNYYSVGVSIPLFTGGQLINSWRLAKVNRQLGMTNIQKEKDDLAIQTMAAYVDVLYYQGTVRYATEKLEESSRTLYKTKRQEELGLKGKADIAQIEALVAQDDYYLTNQQNQYNTALLTLKNCMNFPAEEALLIDTMVVTNNYMEMSESVDNIYHFAKEAHPTALQSAYQLEASKMQYLIEKGKLLPSISFGAGISTNYYKDLKYEGEQSSFSNQFKNKRREYVEFSLSFPLFNGLRKVTSVRRAKNNLRIAQEQQTEILRQLQTAIEKAVLEREGYAKETIQMEKKREADDFSYRVTYRKFEEGLMSPLDLQTSANILLQSKANLLQKRLMYLIKCKEVNYYKGEPLID